MWKANERKSGRVVALKKIFDAFRNATDAQRTFREILFLQEFTDHPNIIKWEIWLEKLKLEPGNSGPESTLVQISNSDGFDKCRPLLWHLILILRLLNVVAAKNDRDIYLVFEFMETDLHAVIRKGGILQDAHQRYIMAQLLRATAFLHSGNVIHRYESFRIIKSSDKLKSF